MGCGPGYRPYGCTEPAKVSSAGRHPPGAIPRSPPGAMLVSAAHEGAHRVSEPACAAPARVREQHARGPAGGGGKRGARRNRAGQRHAHQRERLHQRRRVRAPPRLRGVARAPRPARSGRPVPSQRHRRGQRRRPLEAPGHGARGGGGRDRGPARLRALGADLLRRVRRAEEEARAREGDRRMSREPGPGADGVVRPARRADLARIWELLHGLAVYERIEHEVVGSEEQLGEHLFGADPKAGCLVADVGGRLIGYALFYPTFSSFSTTPNLWLEDLNVDPDARARGLGRALPQAVARAALGSGCRRMGWAVLDWNQPSIEFYRRLGATPAGPGWLQYRLDHEALRAVAAGKGAGESTSSST